MGRHKFRLSDMMPNAWFYKLKDMGRTGKKATTSSHIPTPPPPSPMKHPGVIHPGRASYYVPSAEDKYLDSPVFRLRASDAKFLIVDSPRKSKEKQRRAAAGKKAPKVVLTSSSSVSSGCSCRAAWKAEALPEYPLVEAAADDYDGIPCSDKPVVSEHLQCSSKEVPCSCRVTSSAAADNITDVNGVSRKAGSVFDAAVAEIDLPPILTKPARRAPDGYGFSRHEPITPAIKEQRRRSSAGTQHGGLGLRMRTNSPRIAVSKRAIAQGRRSNANANASARGAMPRKTEGLPGSLAVVKSSSDPQRDFRDSMLEMIVENNIRASKDLEELLACYLSLNSNEYHDVIVEVFEQIWFDLTSIRLQRPEKASLSQTNRNECKI